MLLLGRRSRATQPLRMINRGTKALNTPFHLFSFGLIGAANIILFSVASVSFLTAEKKPLIVSSSGAGPKLDEYARPDAELLDGQCTAVHSEA